MIDDNKLLKINDDLTIYNFLLGAKEKDCDIYIWKMVGSSKYLSKVKIESVRKSRKDFCIIPEEGFDTQVDELMANQSFIDLYIPDSILLFRCKIKHEETPQKYYLEIPAFVAHAERRKSFRLNSYDKSDIKVTFYKSTLGSKRLKQHFLKNCFDIGVGGFSFYVSKAELRFFDINHGASSILLKIGDWSTTVTAKILSIREFGPDKLSGLNYKAYRISCTFVEIDPISKKYLERYIFEQIKEELHAINT